VPVGAVVEPLLVVVDEPHVARVAGRRRHPRSHVYPPLSVRLLGLAGTSSTAMELGFPSPLLLSPCSLLF
jgi:hypothetical protein